MAGEAASSGLEAQGEGKSSISGQVGDEVPLNSKAGAQHGGEEEGEGDEEFEDVRVFRSRGYEMRS